MGKRRNQQPRQPRPKPRKVAPGMAVVPRLHPSAMVHVNPFSRYAEGARILDGFRAMTETYPIPTSDILSTGSDGTAQFLVLPSLSCSALVLHGSISNTNGIFTFSSGAASSSSNATDSLTPVTVAGVSVDQGTNLRSVGTSYRLVGWGVVIKTLPGVSSTGRVILTKFTARGKAPPKASDLEPFLTENATFFTGANAILHDTSTVGAVQTGSVQDDRPSIASFLRTNGLPPLGGADSAVRLEPEALRRIPGTVTASVASLGVNALLVRGKRTSVECTHWRGVGPSPASVGSLVTGMQKDTTTTASPNTVGNITNYLFGKAFDSTYLDLTGHDGLAIVVSGAAANTSVLDYEIIYHVEVTPRTEALLTSLRPPVMDAGVTPMQAAAAHRAHAQTPHFQLVPHHFRELANGALTGLAGRVSDRAMAAVSSTAGGVIGRAMAMGLEGAMGALAM